MNEPTNPKPITGTVRIEFQIVDGNLKLMLHAPMQTEAERKLTVEILASAIPSALNFQPSIIDVPKGTGKLTIPAGAKTH